MKIKVLPRAECFAAAHGWGIEYGIADFDVPTLIISISSYDTPIPNALAIDAKKSLASLSTLSIVSLTTLIARSLLKV